MESFAMAPSYASPQDSPTVKVLNFFLGGLSKAPEAVDEGDYGTAAVEIAGVLPWGKLLKVLKFARLFSHTDEAVDVTRAFRALPEDEALRSRNTRFLGATSLVFAECRAPMS